MDENIQKQRAVIPLIEERAEAMKRLSGKQFAAKADYLELEQERIERNQDLKILRRQREATDAAVAQARQALTNARAAFRGRLLKEQTELSARRHGLKQELAKLKQREDRQTLRVAVSGVIQQLTVHTIGGVVTPAQELLVIVPEGNTLEVEAYVENKDIGFVTEGQEVEVKVDAFPFTKYGTLDGTVTALSRDAVEHEQLGWAFSTRVALSGNVLTGSSDSLPVAPGMSVQVEVQTGERRVIEFLLTPILKGFQESGRER